MIQFDMTKPLFSNPISLGVTSLGSWKAEQIAKKAEEERGLRDAAPPIELVKVEKKGLSAVWISVIVVVALAVVFFTYKSLK